jgi:hypothetical protein
VTGFPEFPNTSPSGKQVDSDDPFHESFGNLVTNVTLGTTEGTRFAREPNLNKATDQAPGEDSIPEEGGEAEDPQDSRTTTQKILTSIDSIMGVATAPKDAQKQRKTWQEFSKRRH